MIGIIDEGILKKGFYPKLISSRKVYIQAHTQISMAKNARCVICLEFIKRIDDGDIHRCADCSNEHNIQRKGLFLNRWLL